MRDDPNNGCEGYYPEPRLSNQASYLAYCTAGLLQMPYSKFSKTSNSYPITRNSVHYSCPASAFDILFIGCVLNKKIAYTTAKKLMFEAFY